MPHKDPEKRKQYAKEYREKHRLEKIEYYKKYHRGEINIRPRLSKEERREKERIRSLNRSKSHPEERRKFSHIYKWKTRGVKSYNYHELYDYYNNIKNCEICNIELTIDRYNKSTTKVLDHCHLTGHFRNVICQKCNLGRGAIDRNHRKLMLELNKKFKN
jgi:hypothetical protein